jgi:hypothetical protein
MHTRVFLTFVFRIGCGEKIALFGRTPVSVSCSIVRALASILIEISMYSGVKVCSGDFPSHIPRCTTPLQAWLDLTAEETFNRLVIKICIEL